MSKKYSQKLLDSAKKSTTDAIKTASKRAIQKTSEATAQQTFAGAQDVLKTCLEDVLKTSWGQTKCLLGISVSNHGLLKNLNQYLKIYVSQIYNSRIQEESKMH